MNPDGLCFQFEKAIKKFKVVDQIRSEYIFSSARKLIKVLPSNKS